MSRLVDRPWGVLAAAALAWAAVAHPFAPRLDAAVAARARQVLGKQGPPAVAVAVDPRDGTLVAAAIEKARAAGATEVEGPIPEPESSTSTSTFTSTDRFVEVPEIDGEALVRGDAPEELLAGRAVVIDEASRARDRALASVSGLAPTPEPLQRGAAILATLVAFAIAWAAERGRRGLGALFLGASLAIAGGVAVGAARNGVVVSVVELGAAFLAAWIIGRLDGARLLRRLVDRLSRPILRAVPPPPPIEAIGQELADLIGARSLLLLEARGSKVQVACGLRLRAADLRSGLPLDPRRPPFRGLDGIARVAPVGDLLDPPEPGARLFPVGTGAWLLAVFDDPSSMDRCPTAVAAVTGALARTLRLSHSRGEDRLLEAAHALEAETQALSAAFGEARSGLLLASAAGVTRWKNGRFQEILAHVHPQLAGDLPRVVALARQEDETISEALERLLAADGASRVPVPGYALVATVTPLRPHAGAPATGLLVEVDALDAVSARALVPTHAEKVLTLAP